MFGNAVERLFAGRLTYYDRSNGFFDYLITVDKTYRERRRLASLSDEALKDIGLTRAQMDRELDTSIWNPPIQMR